MRRGSVHQCAEAMKNPSCDDMQGLKQAHAHFLQALSPGTTRLYKGHH